MMNAKRRKVYRLNVFISTTISFLFLLLLLLTLLLVFIDAIEFDVRNEVTEEKQTKRYWLRIGGK